jgi:hypothetical protein
MSNVSGIAAPGEHHAKSTTAKKLIQAAALASVLVPLGSVAVETATINCVVQSGCSGTGSYSSGASGSNIWKFSSNDILLYTLLIEGTPDTTFSLDVEDRHVSVENFEEFNIAFPNSECIPFLDEDTCVIFDVLAEGTVDWNEDGYFMEMRWFAPEVEPGESPQKPPDDGRNHIFKSANGFTFDEVLRESDYDPDVDPVDPALGGRGDDFSSFLAGRADVPEPGTLLLFGTGVVATCLRRRRRDR